MKMLKTLPKILLIIAIIIALLLAGLIAFAKYKNAHYYKFTQTEQPIEQRYTEPGEEKVSFAEYKVDDAAIQKHEIWYPADLEKEDHLYPVVVIANRSGFRQAGTRPFSSIWLLGDLSWWATKTATASFTKKSIRNTSASAAIRRAASERSTR